MTEEEYNDLLERIVKGAEYLSNPLIKKEDYEKGMKLYDALCEKALKHRMSWYGEIDHSGETRSGSTDDTEE